MDAFRLGTDRDVVAARLLDIRVFWPLNASVVVVASSAVASIVVRVAVFDITVIAFDVAAIVFDVVPVLLFVGGKGDLLEKRIVSVHAQ